VHGRPNLMRRVLKPAARTAGVEWIGFHALRHTAASQWFRAGLALPVVSRMLGWRDPAFTFRTYVHMLPSDLPDMDALGATLERDRGGWRLRARQRGWERLDVLQPYPALVEQPRCPPSREVVVARGRGGTHARRGHRTARGSGVAAMSARHERTDPRAQREPQGRAA
jgi:integrase-like protein